MLLPTSEMCLGWGGLLVAGQTKRQLNTERDNLAKATRLGAERDASSAPVCKCTCIPTTGAWASFRKRAVKDRLVPHQDRAQRTTSELFQPFMGRGTGSRALTLRRVQRVQFLSSKTGKAG